ncbi:DUF2306 domain-containing protein [Planctomicrobium piriforme]|uniref:Predicted membrane protein n=1 Tax=Planctomicrobium piriforme TaxID=1576369 RepID=A0A1I3AWR2_9PLAN|nr:DUF2306 domain-containing protein [Planctomicrobium piriforme]SFH54390.1 Predicted membrane protein [Planctomicrobium piriforme]
MSTSAARLVQKSLPWLAALLILKVTAAVLLKYVDYFPPNFNSDFLRGREQTFWGSYQWAFYVHIVSGPVSLLLGLLLLSTAFRRRYPLWHRRLGRIQGLCVLLMVVPSGLWMSFYAAAGPIAATAFASLSLATGFCTASGWRAAMQRHFKEHERWMQRSYLLLCSAVFIRILGGLGTVLEVQSLWFDPIASWVCWVVPLAILEKSSVESRVSRARGGVEG